MGRKQSFYTVGRSHFLSSCRMDFASISVNCSLSAKRDVNLLIKRFKSRFHHIQFPKRRRNSHAQQKTSKSPSIPCSAIFLDAAEPEGLLVYTDPSTD